MAGRKRRRSAFDNDTECATDLPKIVIPPDIRVASTSKRKDATRLNHVQDKKTAGSSPPCNKPRLKSAARPSTAEPATSTGPSAVRKRVTRASSVSMPSTPLWYITSSGIPACLPRGGQSDIFSKSQDILTTKEALDSSEPSREEHRPRKTEKSNAPQATLRKKRGRPSRTIQSDDEASKATLMQQWATLRMSQGTLLSTTAVGKVLDAIHVPGNRGHHELPVDGRSQVEIPSCEVAELNKPPDFFSASDHVETTCLWPSVFPLVEPVSDVNITHETISSPAIGITPNTPSGRSPLLDDLRYPTSSPETSVKAQQADVGMIEAISQASPHPATNISSELANKPLELPATNNEAMLLQPPVTCIMSEFAIPSATTESGDPQSRVSPSNVRPLVSREADVEDATLDFHMLDLYEILSSWVPASPDAPSVYVPPAVHHLIADMKYQLEAECQARRRAEELYLEEMQRRMKMEEVIGKLQKEKIRLVEQKASSARVYVSNANSNAACDAGQTTCTTH